MIYKYIKRILDIISSLLAIIILSPLLGVLTVIGAFEMKGNPFFAQERPGKDEKIFKLVKFRTMTNAKDKDGNLLSDADRLTRYGKFLRNTSLDELPELFNILKGDMSVIGPRPQLVRDMVFMTPEQRLRHTVRPGLSGLAQTRGRNALSWDGKLATDLEYIQKVTFLGDVKIIFDTVKQVFFREKGLEDSDVDEVDMKRNVNVNAQNQPVAEVLDKVFDGTGVYYAMEGKNIMLMKKNTQQQDNKVTGVVKDANGDPIIGANVTVKGKSIGTITDIDGRFILNAPSDAVLQITYIGYVAQDVKIDNRKEEAGR